jgi:hypothetical protein
LDARRVALGLGPLATAVEERLRVAKETPPLDPAGRLREFDGWARRTGRRM